MHEYDFSEPQRQSKVGLVLIFGSTLFHLIKNLWVVVIYFLVKEVDRQVLLLFLLGSIVLLLITLGFSIVAFLNFKFHIDQKNREFVLQKGVFSTDIINVPFEKIQQVNFRRNLLQRIIGVYSVVVETAGSQEKEIEIKALFQDKANELAEFLMELKNAEVGKETDFSDKGPEGSKPDWEHHVSISTLLKLGITSNYLRGVGLIIAFYFTLREQFMLEEFLPADITRQQMIEKGSYIFMVILLGIGMIITVAETVIKYYDLNLKKFRDSLQVEMGLRNNTKVNIRAARVQLVEVSTSPIQKLLKLFTLKISLASSENDLEKSRIKIPGLSPEVVEKTKEFFFKRQIEEKVTILPHKIILWRKMSRGAIPAIIGIILGLMFPNYISGVLLGGIVSGYMIFLSIYNYFYYKRLKLTTDTDILVKISGVWVRKQQYLEIYRLQAISIRQPLWYKRKGIVNLSFHSAGGDFTFDGVLKEEVIPLVNYLLYDVEKNSKPWM